MVGAPPEWVVSYGDQVPGATAPDAGAPEAGAPEAGTAAVVVPPVPKAGSGCSVAGGSGGGFAGLAFILVAWLRRRRG